MEPRGLDCSALSELPVRGGAGAAGTVDAGGGRGDELAPADGAGGEGGGNPDPGSFRPPPHSHGLFCPSEDLGPEPGSARGLFL